MGKYYKGARIRVVLGGQTTPRSCFGQERGVGQMCNSTVTPLVLRWFAWGAKDLVMVVRELILLDIEGQS
jgi:hypothetical protein